MGADHSATRRAAVALAAALSLAALTGCGAGSSSPGTSQPRQSQDTVAPSGGLPGAVDRAGQVKDQTNQRTRDLENQVQSYGR